jgi:hypothetical protein
MTLADVREELAARQIEALIKQKDQAYSERNKVVAALAHVLSHVFFSNINVGVAQHDINDKDWEADWRTILVIELPAGQVTWHFHDSEKYLLEGLPTFDDYKWDGHTTEEKYNRLLREVGIIK